MAYFPHVKPLLESGGNISIQTAANGTSYTAFAAQACGQLTILNDTGFTLEFRQGATGVALPIFDGTYYTIFGITDANQIDVRRKDTTASQVTVKARWEA